jgi:hypothetical protein
VRAGLCRRQLGGRSPGERVRAPRNTHLSPIHCRSGRNRPLSTHNARRGVVERRVVVREGEKAQPVLVQFPPDAGQGSTGAARPEPAAARARVPTTAHPIVGSIVGVLPPRVSTRLQQHAHARQPGQLREDRRNRRGRLVRHLRRRVRDGGVRLHRAPFPSGT